MGLRKRQKASFEGVNQLPIRDAAQSLHGNRLHSGECVLCTMAEFVQKKSKTVLLLNVLGQIHERGEMLHNITGLIPDGVGLRDVVDQILLPFGLNDRRGGPILG
jgi:hypothetical protein